MKSKLVRAGLIVVIVLAAAYAGTVYFLGSAVAAGVNRFGPSITQTPVHLDGARLSPFSGGGSLSGLLVGNPAGWSGKRAFYFKKIHVSVVPSSVFSDCIIVNDLTIDGPEFNYETRVVSSNIGDLLKNIEGSSSSPQASAQPVTKAGKPLRFIVRHFSMTGGHVTLGIGPTALTLPMPPLTLNDIGTQEGGVPPAQLAAALMRSAAEGVVTATTNAAGKVGSTLGADATHAVESLFGKKH